MTRKPKLGKYLLSYLQNFVEENTWLVLNFTQGNATFKQYYVPSFKILCLLVLCTSRVAKMSPFVWIVQERSGDKVHFSKMDKEYHTRSVSEISVVYPKQNFDNLCSNVITWSQLDTRLEPTRQTNITPNICEVIGRSFEALQVWY